MGSSTGSMFWMFVCVTVIYIVGMLIYTIIEKIKKHKRNKKDNKE